MTTGTARKRGSTAGATLGAAKPGAATDPLSGGGEPGDYLRGERTPVARWKKTALRLRARHIGRSSDDEVRLGRSVDRAGGACDVGVAASEAVRWRWRARHLAMLVEGMLVYQSVRFR